MKVVPILLSLAILTLGARTGSAENLLKNGSFEEPKIEGRIDARKGVSPAVVEETSWGRFQSRDPTGKVSAGMTDEMARTGKQSVYVQFDNAERTKGAVLVSRLIPVKGGEKYRISIWGRIDRKRPLTLDQGRPYLALEVEFYPADEETRIGETDVRTQMIPGAADRLLFLSSGWSEYYAEFKAPSQAEFIKVVFNWEAPKREGPADGIILFDDAAVKALPGTSAPPPDAPAVDAKPEPAGATPGAAAPALLPAPLEKPR